jgi:pyruvate dehydrogenase E2 component (dihydrolipoamide acetyltransferase)
MSIEVKMPKLSDSMTEAAVVTWIRKVGDTVAAGDPIAELETDKSTVDLEAPASGRISEILVSEGTEGVPVGMLLAVIEDGAGGESGVAASGKGAGEQADASDSAGGSKGEAAPARKGEAGEAVDSKAAVEAAPWPHEGGQDSGRTGAAGDADEIGEGAATKASDGSGGSDRSGDGGECERSQATPLAARMAEQAGLDLAGIQGSGARGRIVKADIEAAVDARDGGGDGGDTEASQAAAGSARSSASSSWSERSSRSSSAAERSAGDESAASGANTPKGSRATSSSRERPAPGDYPLSRMRRTIARRLGDAKRDIPHFYLDVECTVDRLLEARRELNEWAEGYKISLNDFVVRAAAVALSRVPEANASWGEDSIRIHETVDIAVAVATDAGLVTPIVRDVAAKGLRDISMSVRELADKARAGRLDPKDYDGGTFTVSNLGMYGIDTVFAIINPPQACILGVGRAVEKPVVRDGQLGVGTVMKLSLSADHRVIDGATGARLLDEIRRLLEDPMRMLL